MLVLHVTDDEEYEEMRQTMERIPDSRARYSNKRAVEGPSSSPRTWAAKCWTASTCRDAVGRVGDEQAEILETAADRDRDHLFVAGEKRSPAGKALFGDLTQSIILNFDGPVTVMTE